MDRFHPGADMAESKIVLVGGTDKVSITKQAMENAAVDARHLMTNSPIIPKLVSMDIVLRQLFLMVRNAIDNEVRHGWTVENPALVLQTLTMSAQEKAVGNTPAAATLRQDVLETILPIVDIFCKMEEEQNALKQSEPATETTDHPVPGDDNNEAD